jgi:3'-phosphoadenosine 5'-phosphosulfate sulfotransferase (PAPS reductase)/FAD synthetase
MKVKKNILISFSGGETSAYMLQYILANYSNRNIKIVFANTGDKHEETLIFVQKCSEYFF